MTWQQQIPGCFGQNDHKFAQHPLDTLGAIRLLLAVKEAQASYGEVEDEIKTYLTRKKCTKQHIRTQVGRLKRLYGPWF